MAHQWIRKRCPVIKIIPKSAWQMALIDPEKILHVQAKGVNTSCQCDLTSSEPCLACGRSCSTLNLRLLLPIPLDHQRNTYSFWAFVTPKNNVQQLRELRISEFPRINQNIQLVHGHYDANSQPENWLRPWHGSLPTMLDQIPRLETTQPLGLGGIPDHHEIRLAYKLIATIQASNLYDLLYLLIDSSVIQTIQLWDGRQLKCTALSEDVWAARDETFDLQVVSTHPNKNAHPNNCDIQHALVFGDAYGVLREFLNLGGDNLLFVSTKFSDSSLKYHCWTILDS
jgi:hypothetical protein